MPLSPRRTAPATLRRATGPEAEIQAALLRFLKIKDWHVMETHGNMYQAGFPDLYICHYSLGTRWVEVKVKDKYKFTPAQLKNFPMMSAKGVGIWILTAATENEYRKLQGPANWAFFLDIMKPNSRLRLT